MAYSTSNPPREILGSGLTSGSSVFLYESADAHTDVDESGYFNDGTKHGMKLGDIVIVRTTSSGATTLHSVITVAAKSGSGHVADHTPRAVTISSAVLA